MIDALALDLVGIAEGADKAFTGNDYLRHYARVLERYRHAPINLLEIGVASGASLRTWRRYFSQATIIGIDIQPSCRQHAGDRMIVEIGSQTDIGFLQDLARTYQPTIIIDDGSHVSDHQIISLEALFALLPLGGIYLIEDLFFQVNPKTTASFRGENPQLAIDYLLACARDRAGWLLEDPSAARRRSLVLHHLDRIEFFNGAAALFRREQPLSPETAIELAEAALRNTTHEDVGSWGRIYEYALRLNRPEAATRAADRMLALGAEPARHAALIERIRERSQQR